MPDITIIQKLEEIRNTRKMSVAEWAAELEISRGHYDQIRRNAKKGRSFGVSVAFRIDKWILKQEKGLHELRKLLMD